MVVKKKVQPTSVNRDKIDLSSKLETVKRALSNLPDEEGAVMNETVSNAATDQLASAVAKKSSAKKAPVKKAAAKKAPAKKAPAKKSPTDGVTLAQICKELKLEPHIARRRLRTAKLKNPGRWSWPKGDSEINKVKTVLKAN